MVALNSGIKMLRVRHYPRVNTIELKNKLEKKLGRQKAVKYFNLLGRYLNGKLSKLEFDKVCVGLVGRENIRLHNGFVQAIIKNAFVSKSPPPKDSNRETSLNVFHQCPRKGRTPTPRWGDGKFRDHPGPHGKTHEEQHSATEMEMLSLGSRPPIEVNSVEDGEEVEQAAESPGIYSRSLVKAPFGVHLHTKGTKKILPCTETCQNTGMLPDTNSLRKRVEHKMEMGGLSFSTDCINILNVGLDVFMKRLFKRSFGFAASHSASVLDFRVAMELNPRLLGEDWPLQLEKIILRGSETIE